MKAQASVARSATSLYAANIIVLVANTLYFLVLTNFLRSTLGVGIVTALNIMIWFLVTVCILAQPIAMQSPVPAPLAVLKFIPELLAKRARSGAGKLFTASLAFSLVIGGVIASVLMAAPTLIIPFLGGQAVSLTYVRLSGVDVLVVSLGQVCVGTLIALGEMKSATLYLILWSAAALCPRFRAFAHVRNLRRARWLDSWRYGSTGFVTPAFNSDSEGWGRSVRLLDV